MGRNVNPFNIQHLPDRPPPVEQASPSFTMGAFIMRTVDRLKITNTIVVYIKSVQSAMLLLLVTALIKKVVEL